MIVQISEHRRLVREKYCWRIERLAVPKKPSKKKSKPYWAADNPAYPATLEQALKVCLEREMADAVADQTIDIRDLPEAIETALKSIMLNKQKVTQL